MLAMSKTAALVGIDGIGVGVEVDSAKGLPSFTVIGLGDTAVKEAAERVRSAVINSGFQYPKGRITVNLTPAWIHKRGSHYDLSMALAILSTEGIISEKAMEDKAFIGELNLNGSVMPVKGVLPMIKGLKEGVKEIFLPAENCQEGYLLTSELNIRLVPVRSLKEAVELLTDGRAKRFFEGEGGDDDDEAEALDFADVKGHWLAKEAIVTAVAGGHGLLMVGPPGTGKTMLARRIPTILPKMTALEQLETTMVYSLVGKFRDAHKMMSKRPFRQLNKRATAATILGGGHEPLPGEVSLANNGILFIDEFLEFSRGQIELLRKPIEDGEVTITRRGRHFVFPARFTLIGAANPCKCGFLGDVSHACTCSQSEIDKYRSRLSGPLADRIDMCVEVCRVDYKALVGASTPSSDEMRERVLKARRIQRERYVGTQVRLNGQMSEAMIKEYCHMSKKGAEYMKKAYSKFAMSPRRYHKVLRVARTVADIEGATQLETYHLATALNYTRFFGEIGDGEAYNP